MKLYCLSGTPNKPCFVLQFKGTTMMLDCGLDMAPILNFLPLPVVQSSKFSDVPNWTSSDIESTKLDDELKEIAGQVFINGEPEFGIPELGLLDLSEVDVLLLSNYQCMLALPYITEYTGFHGQVYATEPTLQIGRMYMEEFVNYITRNPKPSRATKWKQPDILKHLPPTLRDAIAPQGWQKIYNLHDINASLAKVQMAGFNERLNIFGALRVTAVSSGFCLGSSNWLIHSDYEKIAYVSGSSTLTTHPKPMEQSALKNCDILIMCSLMQTPTANPDAMIGEFCVNAAMTLRNGGNVLVPCYASGVTYDLFECLSGHLDSCGLAQVPMYFISPVADSSLAYSNIFSEWLSSGKQTKVYLPEPPFPHAELVTSARLRHYPSLHEGFNNDLKTPCIVFTGHPSLRCGNVVHFLELWGKSSGNTLIFTEPDFPYLEALAPYQPLAMKVSYCPIDTSLSFIQANKLIRDLKPLHLVVSETYITPPAILPHRTDLVIECEPAPVTYRRAEILTLPIRRRFERIEIEPELAASLQPSEVRPGVSVAMVTGALVSKDNKHVLQQLPQGVGLKRKWPGEDTKTSYVWGSVDIQEFVESLAKQGISDVKVEDAPNGHIVHLPSEDILIQIEEGSTHIICEGNEAIRIKLRDTLLACLEKL